MMIGQRQKFTVPYDQFSEHDEQTLTELVNKVSRGMFCEIGCWVGHSTSIIAKRAKELGTRVIVIDTFEGSEGTSLTDYAKENNVEKLFRDNMEELGFNEGIGTVILYKDDSSNAHKYIGEFLSFLFIDGSHKYEDVKNDILNYKDKILPGGIIAGHDYESDTYDELHINEDYVNGKHHGVIKAVNEVCGTVEYNRKSLSNGRIWWKQL